MIEPMHGDKQRPERITLRQMLEVMLSLFNLERGLGYTLKSLLLSPRGAIQEYLFEDRRRIIHPLRFLFFTTAIAAFLNIQFVLNEEDFRQGVRAGSGAYELQAADDPSESTDNAKRQEVTETVINSYFRFMTDYQNLLLLMFVPIAALSTWIFFRKKGLFYAEHLALNSFAIGFQNLIFILFVPFLNLHSTVMLLYFALAILYLFYFYVKVFDNQDARSVLASMTSIGTAYLLYMSAFVVALILLLVNMLATNEALRA